MPRHSDYGKALPPNTPGAQEAEGDSQQLTLCNIGELSYYCIIVIMDRRYCNFKILYWHCRTVSHCTTNTLILNFVLLHGKYSRHCSLLLQCSWYCKRSAQYTAACYCSVGDTPQQVLSRLPPVTAVLVILPSNYSVHCRLLLQSDSRWADL